MIDAGLGPAAAARHLLETHPEGDPWVVAATAGRRPREPARRAPPKPPAATSPAPCANPRPPRSAPPSCTNSAAPPCSPSPPTTVNHLRGRPRRAHRRPRTAPRHRLPPLPGRSRTATGSPRPSETARPARSRVATDARARLRMQSEQFMWDAFRADEPDSPGPLPPAGPARRPPHRPRPHRALRHRAARLGRHPARRTRRRRPAARRAGARRRTAPGPTPTAGFEVPVLVAMTYMYADRPGTRRGALRRRHRRLRAPGLARRPPLLRLHAARLRPLPPRPARRGGGLRPRRPAARRTRRTAAPPSSGTRSRILVAVLLARGRADEAAALAADYALPRALPGRRHLPRRPDRARRTAARPRPAPGGRRRTGRGGPPARPARHAQPRLVPLAAPPRPRRGHRRPGPGPRHRAATRCTGPGSSAPRPPSGRPCASPPRSPPAPDRAAASSPSPSLTSNAPRPATSWPAPWSPSGTALRRAGRPGEAAEHLYRGLDAAVRCGADGLAGAAREELALAGLRPRRLHSAETDTLTARERAAAALTARDRTRRRGRRGAAHRRAGRRPAAVGGLPQGRHRPHRARRRPPGAGPVLSRRASPAAVPPRRRTRPRSPVRSVRRGPGRAARPTRSRGRGGRRPRDPVRPVHVPWRHVLPPPPQRRHARRARTSTSWPWTRATGPATSARAAARARRQLPGRLPALRPVRRPWPRDDHRQSAGGLPGP